MTKYNEKGIIGEYHFSYGVDNVNRTALINHLLQKYNLRTYLEIGVRNPNDNFNLIKTNSKIGVDPNPLIKLNNIRIQTSDEFFDTISVNDKFDIIFIDGLHLEYQCTKDIENSLRHLNDNGFILLHDCNPPSEKHQIEYYDGKSPWNGTVWKSLARLRMSNPNVEIKTVNTDTGVGIITKRQNGNILLEKETNLNWEYLCKNRNSVLNLISVDDFLSFY
jgi:hypothetical protein